jgi:hypothetical protein
LAPGHPRCHPVRVPPTAVAAVSMERAKEDAREAPTEGVVWPGTVATS